MKFEFTPERMNYLNQAVFWAKTNWLKLSAIILLLFLILKKDISFEINLISPNPKKEHKQVFTANNQSEKPNQFSLAANPTPKQTFKEATSASPEIIVVTRNNLDAQKFANISILLQPSLTTSYSGQLSTLQQKKKNCIEYVNKFKSIAIGERTKFGIPVSITLAQGLLESDAGQSRLAKKSNNHFGIKCFSKTCGKGHCTNHTDDTHKDFFRNYKSNWDSFRDHSKLLQKERYLPLKRFPIKDYKNWAYGLRKAGYATDRRYAEKLIKIIEELKLYELD